MKVNPRVMRLLIKLAALNCIALCTIPSTMQGENNKNIPPQSATTTKIGPENLVICFDVDQVLLTFPDGIVRKELWRHKKSVFKNIWNRKLIKKIVKMAREGAPSQEFEDLFAQLNKPGLMRLIQHITHSKIVIEGMIELITELKKQGYTLHIVSNMGSRDFEFYKTKYPTLFNLFDASYVVTYEKDKKAIKKPDPAYFEAYCARYPTHKARLFIDDKAINCTASGFEDTIVFSNVARLRTELTARGIL